MRSPRMATSPLRPGCAVPSYRVAPRMTISACTAGSAVGRSVRTARVVKVSIRIFLSVFGSETAKPARCGRWRLFVRPEVGFFYLQQCQRGDLKPVCHAFGQAPPALHEQVVLPLGRKLPCS